MLEQFLNSVYHPNRAVEVLHAITLLFRLGLTGYTDKIDEILMAETGTEPLVMAGHIEASVRDGLFTAYAQYGIDIEYDTAELSTIVDLLEFLAAWDTAEGVSPQSYPDELDIRELGRSNIDILIELFEMAGKNHDGHLIDWLDNVSDNLIARLEESFKKRPELLDEPSSISVTSLNDFRLFAVHFPESMVVKYIRSGGAVGLSISTMMIKNDHWLMGRSVNEMAIEIAGMALVSDMSRDTLREDLGKLVEPVLGSTVQGQVALKEINRVLTKVLNNGNH